MTWYLICYLSNTWFDRFSISQSHIGMEKIFEVNVIINVSVHLALMFSAGFLSLNQVLDQV